MYFYGDVEPPKRLAFAGGSRLGLQEGEPRLDCPPGQVKAYLPEWPYQKCVPAEEALEPRPGEVPVTTAPAPAESPGAPPPAPPAPAAPPPVAPAPEAPAPEAPPPPGKARLLDIDPETGTILDPDTRQPLESESAFFLGEGARPIVGAVVGLGVITLALWALGAFK